MREKLLMFVSACLGVTLILGLLLGRDNRVTENLDADVMAYNSDTSVSQFSEVIAYLDEFVQYCADEDEPEKGGPDGVAVDVVTTTVTTTVEETGTSVTKEIRNVVAIPETTTTTAVVTTVATTKPKPVTTTKPKPVTTVTTTTPKPETTTTAATTTEETTTTAVVEVEEEEEIFDDESEIIDDGIDWFESIMADDDEETDYTTKREPSYWTTIEGD